MSGYVTVVTGSAEEGFVVKNTHVPDKPDTPDKPGSSDKTDTSDKSETTVPDTGDHSNIGMWLGLLIGSALSMVGMVIYRRKKI